MLLLLLLLIGTSTSVRHHCTHKQRLPIITYLPKSGQIQQFSSPTPKPIRIYIHYEEAFNNLPNQRFLKKNIIEPAVTYWKNTVKVKYPLSEPILLDRPCVLNNYDRVVVNGKEMKVCRHACVNDSKNEHLQEKCYYYGFGGEILESGERGEGVIDADLVILVDSGIDCNNVTLASALEERIESTYNRPIIGSLSICPDTMNMSMNIEESIQTIKHEIMHILGFSVSLFAYFRDQKGDPLTERDDFGQPNLGLMKGKGISAYKPNNNTMIVFNHKEMTPVGLQDRQKAMLVTPNIVRVARNYYNCSTLKGVLLENFGEKGNAWSHFEMSIAYNELMASVSSEESHVSGLSLALLEDSGWYVVDYSRAENFTYGKGLGCNFVNENCFEYMHSQLSKNQSSAPWCSNVDETICSPDRSIEHKCSYTFGNNSIPAEYRYFKDKRIFNSDPFIEYCPMYMVFMKKSFYNLECEHRADINKVDSPYNLIQSYGHRSKCFSSPFDSSLIVNTCGKTMNQYTNSAGCYKYRCSPIHGLTIIIKGQPYSCRQQSEQIFFDTIVDDYDIRGKIQCPKCNEICDASLCEQSDKILRRKTTNSLLITDDKRVHNNTCSIMVKNGNVLTKFILASIIILMRNRSF